MAAQWREAQLDERVRRKGRKGRQGRARAGGVQGGRHGLLDLHHLGLGAAAVAVAEAAVPVPGDALDEPDPPRPGQAERPGEFEAAPHAAEGAPDAEPRQGLRQPVGEGSGAVAPPKLPRAAAADVVVGRVAQAAAATTPPNAAIIIIVAADGTVVSSVQETSVVREEPREYGLLTVDHRSRVS